MIVSRPGLAVRLARPTDAEAIRSIYNLEVSESTVTFDLVPRSPVEQRSWMADHDGVHPAVVAERDGEVVAFGSLGPYRSRPAYSTTVEDSVYVRRDSRGTGCGRAILAELVRLGTVHGFHSVMARIVGGHEASIALHRGCGFELVGIEREVGRKFGRWLDVVLMQLLLSQASATPLPGPALAPDGAPAG
jgi:L-amino acid N-acyltransferase YncA